MRLADLEKYNQIVIQVHDNPDADAVGSGYAIYRYLKPCYLEDFDEDYEDDFDDDFFEDEEEDDIPIPVPVEEDAEEVDAE